MANERFHEDPKHLSDETKEMHRAIVSLMKELAAVDWSNQSCDASQIPN